MNPPAISCDRHDYLEIACLYGYQVRLKLQDGQIIEGKAVDIATENKCEYLLVRSLQVDKIAVTQLAKLEVLTPHAKFHTVSFP